MSSSEADKFIAEIGWREFSAHLLHHFPYITERAFRPEYDAMPWRKDDASLRAWRQGRTGYPLVDAGMRQLWTTGWMHNRVRMVVASFLIKHLLIDWREGEAWFWDTLVDADRASNAQNWQWVAGSGADASPSSASSIPSRRVKSSIPTAAMSVGGCLNFAACRTAGYSHPGAHPLKCCVTPESF